MNDSQKMFLAVAEQVARKWNKRGFSAYPYEDMKHDAYVAAASAVDKYRPDKRVSLEGYLYSSAYIAVYLKVNRALSPVSTRSNAYVRHMRETVKQASLDGVDIHSETKVDDHVFNVQVRQYLNKLADAVENREALGLLDGTLTARKQAAGDKSLEKTLRNSAKRLQWTFQSNKRLHKMHKELVCRS